MSWSYSGNPADSDLDQVRFLIGDTDVNDQQLSDEEIEFLLAEKGSPIAAAIAAITPLIAKYSRFAKQRTGDISVEYQQIAEAYRKLLEDLKQKAASQATPFVGGISKSDKETTETDTDRVEPAFERGKFDNNRF